MHLAHLSWVNLLSLLNHTLGNINEVRLLGSWRVLITLHLTKLYYLILRIVI